ncbi:MAG: hypothetical protein AAGD88_13425 [Bacteroidota bacterium]
MKWHYITGFFAIVVLLRFTINLSKFLRVKSLYKKYLDYLKNPSHAFAQYSEEIKTLFREAGLKDSSVFHQEFLGFGKFANQQISVFDNLMNKREDIVGVIENRFNQAIGVYKKRFKESFNPLFWIDLVIKLPEYLMSFFGVLPEKILVKVLNLLYWIILIVLGLNKYEIINFY